MARFAVGFAALTYGGPGYFYERAMKVSVPEYQRTSAEEWVTVMRQVIPFFCLVLSIKPADVQEVTSDGFASFKFVSPANEELTITYDDGTYRELVSNN